MVHKEILEGLRVALEKGESLKQAMMSFYNAGYEKKDIEDAARALQVKIIARQQTLQNQQQVKQTPQKEKQKKFKKLEKPKTTIQRVSSYGQIIKKKSDDEIITVLIIILIVVLFLLVGILIFREKVIDFFCELFRIS